MSLSRTSLAAGVALLALAAASQASASAFYLQEQSVRGTGRAYSGEVADKGVGSLWCGIGLMVPGRAREQERERERGGA